ncbi:MFS transporter [Kordiimonas gwangyangensis]|uniref:MFS transporter n=1 Tax=Kordiimonas gwangyangensis TaxID=288022 RepID=UPI00037806E4|nr:MFS transporter [Kordiimonas gwangyangensis]
MSLATTGNRRKLGARHIIYGLPAACFAFPLVPFAVYLPSFYATDMALGFLVVAIALFLSRLVDMISDPLVGMWSDDTGNAWWHRKGWIVAGAVIAAIALVFLCRPPAQPSALYLGLWSAILYIGWTMVMVPYQAWGSELAEDDGEVATYTAAREGCSLLGMLAALSLPMFWDGPLLPSIPNFLLPIGVVTLVLALFLLPHTAASDAVRPRSRFADLWQVFRTAEVSSLSRVWFLTATASAIPAALFPLYVQQVLEGSGGEENLAVLLYFMTAVLAIPLWARASRGRNKKRLMAAGMATVCLVFPTAVFLGPGDTDLFLIVCVLSGAGLGAELVLGPAILADIIRARKKAGQAGLAAIHFAIWGMLAKLAFALAILLSFGLLALFEGLLGEGASAFAVAVVYALLPALIKVVATADLWRKSGTLTQTGDGANAYREP